MEVFTFNHEFVTGLKQNYNLEEGIFLRELYAIMYKQEEIGECYRFVLHYTPPLWRSVNCPCSLN